MKIGDKKIFRGYNQEQVICIVRELVKIMIIKLSKGGRKIEYRRST
jgi:hypothetical protein